jgi:hypothetical protein
LTAALPFGFGQVGPGETSGVFGWVASGAFLWFGKCCGREPLGGVAVVVYYDAAVCAVDPIDVDEALVD